MPYPSIYKPNTLTQPQSQPPSAGGITPRPIAPQRAISARPQTQSQIPSPLPKPKSTTKSPPTTPSFTSDMGQDPALHRAWAEERSKDTLAEIQGFQQRKPQTAVPTANVPTQTVPNTAPKPPQPAQQQRPRRTPEQYEAERQRILAAEKQRQSQKGFYDRFIQPSVDNYVKPGLEGLGIGAMQTADKLNPFSDGFADGGLYDRNDPAARSGAIWGNIAEVTNPAMQSLALARKQKPRSTWQKQNCLVKAANCSGEGLRGGIRV